jgi:hypothetical protein
MTHAMFGSDTFVIFPYSSARGTTRRCSRARWWFYHKVGFRPRSTAALRIMRLGDGSHAEEPRASLESRDAERLAEHSLYFTNRTPTSRL